MSEVRLDDNHRSMGIPLKVADLSDKEQSLIKLCREIGYGQFTVHCENGQPVRVVEPLKSIKL